MANRDNLDPNDPNTTKNLSYLEQEKRRAEKKNLKIIDHSTYQYEPIRKNLYIEVKEIT